MSEKEFDNKKHQLQKVRLESEMYDHYVSIIENMLKWCVYKQPEDIDVMATLFGVNKRALTLKACEAVLTRWKNETDGNRTQKA